MASIINKAKIVLFDIDGVLIKLPHYFSRELEKQGYKNAEASLNSYYHDENNIRCLEGNADSKNMIMPYLQKFGWRGSAEAYLDKQYDYESKYLDKNLMFIVKELRSQGIKCCLCADQDKNRAKFILDDLDFQNIFDGHFISCYIGHRKCHDDFWKRVIGDFEKEFPELKRDEIVFFDDIQNNIDVASKFEIRALLYKDVDQLSESLFVDYLPFE